MEGSGRKKNGPSFLKFQWVHHNVRGELVEWHKGTAYMLLNTEVTKGHKRQWGEGEISIHDTVLKHIMYNDAYRL